ncbi:HAMP domain-containing sensor histidine kinase [Moraxella sp. DOX410]|nr:HAMP domain-containing sensor histidine kinase [Moraxella sp. DOX410]WNP26856.1 HAMP domain-containing sensor histidine kinase [Moraxella sp. DOX410]
MANPTKTALPLQKSLQKSLQKQLLVWILGTLLSIGILVQIAVFCYTYQEFNTSQETNLSYLAELVGSRSTVRPPPHELIPNRRNLDNNLLPHDLPPPRPPIPAMIASAPSSSTPTTVFSPNDEGNVLQYQGVKDGVQVDIFPARFGKIDTNFITPMAHPQLINTPIGFSELTLDGEIWKVFRKDTPRRVIFVRQPVEWQKKIALKSAWQSIIPILLTTLLLLALLPWVLKRVLRPIQILARQMAKRHGQDLSLIELPTDSQHRSILPSELVPLVIEINALLQRVDTHIQNQNRFIADAAHELRSPLTAISLQVQQLQKYSQDAAMYSDPARQAKFKQNIHKLAVRVKHNQHLVEQLLTLARMDAQQSQLTERTRTPTNLIAVLREAIKLLFPIADSKDQTLSVDNHLTALGASATQVSVDETALFILLKNLLQNAILYTQATGNIAVVIDQMTIEDLTQTSSSTDSTYATQDTYATHANFANPLTPTPVLVNNASNKPNHRAKRLIVQVADTGIGIDAAHYQDVFQPFYRVNQNASSASLAHGQGQTSSTQTHSDTAKKSFSTKDTSTHSGFTVIGGTGLGLSIVYQICQQAHIDIYLSPTQVVENNAQTTATTQGLTVTLVFQPASKTT